MIDGRSGGKYTAGRAVAVVLSSFLNPANHVGDRAVLRPWVLDDGLGSRHQPTS